MFNKDLSMASQSSKQEAAVVDHPCEDEPHSRKRQAPSPVHQHIIGHLESENVSRDASRSPFQPLQCSDLQTPVCFGMLCDVSIQVRDDPGLPNSAHRAVDVIVLEICVKEVGEGFWVRHAQGKLFACLTKKVAQGLKRLEHLTQECVQVEGVMSSAAFEEARLAWKKSGKFATKIDVNIYGHPHSAKAVGDALASEKLFLQPPIVNLRSLSYENPQYLQLPGVAEIGDLTPRHEVNTTALLDVLDQDSAQSEIEAILGNLPQPSFLKEVSTDARISTTLVKHQKEAVDFMIRRETGDLPPSMSLWKPQCSDNGFFFWQNVITGAKNSTPEDPHGGILADDMGLGKTLSTLAVVVGSLGRALDFAVARTRTDPQHWHNIVPSKTTLVVVPSSLLLDSWMEEIEKHIYPGTVTTYRYHGLGKRVNMSDLLACDIVLTTYATIAAEFCRGQSILSRIEWYRIVLDEAHTIRNTSTKQFRAIHSIPAHIRWCLTGTPIQNALEDLGALISFLRTPILDDYKTFRKYVTTPVYSRVSGRFANLRRLLEALCLRRTKSLLNLPDPVTDTQMLALSVSETRAYRDFGDSCRHAIDLAVSGHSLKKANHHVIQAVLGMRLFCNDGSSAFLGKCKAHGLPSDPEEALSYLQASEKSTCVQCDSEVLTVYQSDDRSSGVLTTCQHLICGECLPVFEADLDGNLKDGRTHCPICGLHAARDSFLINPKQGHDTTFGKAYPTKLLALLENVQQQGANDKCVVFSFWKKSLDLVANLFNLNGIAFFRIHGSLPAKKRAKVLEEFERSTSITVLLITFGTGGVGINKLMAANYIHILEPQWNPSVETQAIGRILRFGQEKSVKIIRYIMKETVEEAVQSQQLRKLQLARGGFGLSKDEQTSQRMQEIMDLLCPSKPKTQISPESAMPEKRTVDAG